MPSTIASSPRYPSFESRRVGKGDRIEPHGVSGTTSPVGCSIGGWTRGSDLIQKEVGLTFYRQVSNEQCERIVPEHVYTDVGDFVPRDYLTNRRLPGSRMSPELRSLYEAIPLAL